ncbi:MAG: hypothetical protein MUF13_05875, partial [Akkermansiaceae bacterium]|nr:hypothetical protein [Akkermansiaceae bacterium]
ISGIELQIRIQETLSADSSPTSFAHPRVPATQGTATVTIRATTIKEILLRPASIFLRTVEFV